MSLLCLETGEMIMFGSALFAVTRPDIPVVYALSEEVIDSIGQELRRAKSAVELGEGLDIFSADSTENFTGAYTWSGFSENKWLFSITEETAQRLIPHSLAVINADALQLEKEQHSH